MSTTETPTEIRALIESWEDVKRLIRLKELPNGNFRYLIETTFEVFPKFSIGVFDLSEDDTIIELGCGAQWSAEAHWDTLHDCDKIIMVDEVAYYESPPSHLEDHTKPCEFCKENPSQGACQFCC